MNKLKTILRDGGTLLALALIVLVFSLCRPESFFTLGNFINITRQMSLLVIISLGTTLVMSINEFDLSVGAMASFGGILAALLAISGVPMPLCFLAPLLAGGALGALNGWVVARFRVLSFITTLGMSTVLSGITYRLSGGATIFQGIPESFSVPGNLRFGRLPLLSLLMALFVAAFWFLMAQTTLGRKLYAIGGSEETARIAGIRVRRYKVIAFALCGVLAAATGMLVASRVGSANTTAGDGYFLQSYATVFIGCTISRKGVPNVLGTLTGAAIIGVLANGLTMLQMPTYIQDIITGGIIICAVIAQKLGRGDAR